MSRGLLRRRALLGGAASMLAVPAMAEPCGEEERRKLLRFGEWLVPDAQACGGGSGPGPAASSAFLTADFTAAMNYPNGGVGQQVVTPRMWGTSGGGMGNNNFGVWTNSTYTTLLSQINPGLFYFKNSGQSYWNSDLSVNASVVANLVNNFPAVDKLGIAGVIIGTDFNQSPFTTTASQWGTAMSNLATYLAGFTMSNGKKFPLIGMMGSDEPACNNPNWQPIKANSVTYYNALASAGLPSGVTLVGPNTCFEDGNWSDFPTLVPSLGVYSWDTYVEGNGVPFDNPNDLQGFTNQPTRYQNDTAAASTGVSRKPTAFMLGGYNIDSACAASAMNSYVGAVWIGWALINSLNSSAIPFYACMWDGWGDGTCGIITDPINQANQYYGVGTTFQITPKAYVMAQGVRKLVGSRWQVTQNSAGLLTLAVTPSNGHCSVMVVNQGHGAQSGKTVALSHWPVNTSGNATASVWQMTNSVLLPGTDGTVTTTPVTAGVTGALNFPDPSVTIISI